MIELKRILFRVDASNVLGAGHIVRCLTLAIALRSKGHIVEFACRKQPGDLIRRVERNHFKVHRMGVGEPRQQINHNECRQSFGQVGTPDTYALQQETDSLDVLEIIKQLHPDWLIVDNYQLGFEWESALREYVARIMVIDDLDSRSHNCDLFLDQNFRLGNQACIQKRLPEKCRVMLGPSYALLQSEYPELRKHIRRRNGPIRNIFVSFGGSDIDNLSSLVVDSFHSLELKDIALDVAVGPNYLYKESITKKKYPNTISVHHGKQSLANFIAHADIGIGTAGTTVWERCCLGLPSLVISIADNQHSTARDLDRSGFIKWIGTAQTLDPDSLAEHIRAFVLDGFNIEMSAKCHELVDGHGASRVCTAIEDIVD